METLSQLTTDDYKIILFGIIAVLVYILLLRYKRNLWEKQRIERRDYYRNVYLKSDAWKRKRYVVLKRDNWKCVYCGNRATQVHHTRYAKYNIGKEPLK
ncbi:HNH endonuclease [Lacinutrix sp.]|uniref:HNH endonuclease n=1 Tax=Lacinutrix sp. TaxID=1937692 RepID=UPI0035C85FFC